MGMMIRRHYAQLTPKPESEKVPEPVKVQEPDLGPEEEELSYNELKKFAKSKGVDMNLYRSRVDIEEQLKLIEE